MLLLWSLIAFCGHPINSYHIRPLSNFSYGRKNCCLSFEYVKARFHKREKSFFSPLSSSDNNSSSDLKSIFLSVFLFRADKKSIVINYVQIVFLSLDFQLHFHFASGRVLKKFIFNVSQKLVFAVQTQTSEEAERRAQEITRNKELGWIRGSERILKTSCCILWLLLIYYATLSQQYVYREFLSRTTAYSSKNE